MPLDSRDFDQLRGLFGAAPMPTVTGAIALAATMSRNMAMVNTVAIGTTGVMLLTAIMVPGDITVTNISFASGGTAEGTGTHAWLALYTSTLVLLGQGTDNTGAAAITAGTIFTQALTSPVKMPYSGMYYVGIMVAATTVPTAVGITMPGGISGVQTTLPLQTGTTGSGLTNLAPNPAAALSSSVSIPYMYLS